jgi:hypothetical protein
MPIDCPSSLEAPPIPLILQSFFHGRWLKEVEEVFAKYEKLSGTENPGFTVERYEAFKRLLKKALETKSLGFYVSSAELTQDVHIVKDRLRWMKTLKKDKRFSTDAEPKELIHLCTSHVIFTISARSNFFVIFPPPDTPSLKAGFLIAHE